MPRKVKQVTYENNPFFIATNGLTLLFNLAQGVAIMFVIFSVISLFRGNFSLRDSSTGSSDDVTAVFHGWGTTEWLLFVGAISILLLAIMMLSALFGGVAAYTSAKLARDEKVSIGTAFHESFDRLWSFLWLQVIIFVKVLLWSLLFIIPGIVMAVRYSLASVAFYDETKDLKGNAAIKESLRLTKNAWLTTYAANVLFNVITFGAIGNVLSIGTNAVLYKQYDAAGDKKPAAHWLSWLALVLPFAILGLGFFLVVLLGIVIGLVGQHTF